MSMSGAYMQEAGHRSKPLSAHQLYWGSTLKSFKGIGNLDSTECRPNCLATKTSCQLATGRDESARLSNDEAAS